MRGKTKTPPPDTGGVTIGAEYKSKLDDDKFIRDLLLDVGRKILEGARHSFETQRLSRVQWSARYPNQKDYQVNVAGAIIDLKKGPIIQEKRFNNRPALIDTGTLLASLNEGSGAIQFIDRDTIEVGTQAPGARLMYHGGLGNVLTLESPFKKNLYRYLAQEQYRSPFQRILDSYDTDSDPEPVSDEGEAVKRYMSWLFSQKTYQAVVNPRPFIGITGKVRKEIEKAVKKAWREDKS